jgi:hypothetical protein
MTDEEIKRSGDPEYCTHGRTPGTIYGYLSLYVKYPAGFIIVNHAASPTTVRGVQSIAAKYYPTIPFKG